MYNLGSAILILGCIYFGYSYGFTWWLNALIILAAATWAYLGLGDERKELLKAQARYYEAKARYYEDRGR